MIEVVLDSHDNNVFLDAERPVYDEIRLFSGTTLADYRQEARKLIAKFPKTPIVIIKEQPNFSVNMLALAVFIESCNVQNELDCIVFKVSDYEASLQAYKPFVAISIAIKYALRLCQEEDPAVVYREFLVLNYLNFEIKEDYAQDTIVITLLGDAPLQQLVTKTPAEALAAVSALKALSLAQVNANIRLEMSKSLSPFPLDAEQVIAHFMKIIQPFIPLC
jgi:hypothetical protein